MERKNIKVELPHNSVELETPVSKTGILYNSPVPGKQHVLFVPDNPGENEEIKYSACGRLASYRDGTVEFVRARSHKSNATQLAKLDHGTFSKTSTDYYRFQLNVPCELKAKLSNIIRDETMQVLDVIEGL